MSKLYQMQGEYSQRVKGDWEDQPCVVTVGVNYMSVDRPGQELKTGDIEPLDLKLKFHRGWVEVTDDLKALKIDYRFVYNAVTAKFPVRPDQAKLMEDVG